MLQADGKTGIVVAVGSGQALRLTRLKPAGKKAMDGAEFARGYRIETGMAFT